MLRNLLWSLAAVALCAGFGHPALAKESLKIEFDGRPWKVGAQGNDNGRLFTQYILEGEKLEAWGELVVVEFYEGMHEKMTLDQFAARVRALLFGRCGAGDWKFIGKSATDIYYQWSIRLCPNVPDQSEIVRVIKGEDGFHVLRYAVKKGKIDREVHDTWLEVLDKAEIVKG